MFSGILAVNKIEQISYPDPRWSQAILTVLVYAMLTLVCQLLLAVYQAMVLYGIVANDFPVLLSAQRHYAWLIDLSSLSGSIFLFAIR